MRVLVASISKEDYQPYRRNTLVAWSLMLVNGLSIYYTGIPLMNEFWMFMAIAVVGWCCFILQLYYTFDDFKRILNIEVFRIKAKKV